MSFNERHLRLVAFFLLSFLIGWQFPLPLQAQTTNAREILKQYVAQLQYRPNDIALREKIINLALTMKPAPMIPVDAEKFGDRAEYAAKNAKTEADYADAAKEYEKALLIAPWVADYYFNLGVMQEKAGKPTEAMHSFQLYLLAAPDASDARDVRKRIAGLEYANEKNAKKQTEEELKQQQEKMMAEERQSKEQARRNSGILGLQGVWRSVTADGEMWDNTYDHHYIFKAEGDEMIVVCVQDVDTPGFALKGDKQELMKFRLNGRRITGLFLAARKRTTFQGFVNQEFDDIQLTWEDGSSRLQRFEEDN